MRHRVLLTAITALLSFPASSLAASSSGVVLSVNAHRHSLQVVDRRHIVHGYRVHGSLAGVHFASRVHFRLSGRTARHLTVHGTASSVAFLARVLRASSRSVLLKLGDGTLRRMQAKLLRSSSGHRRLTPGTVLLVVETADASGRHKVQVQPVATSSETGTPEVSGQIIELDQTALLVQPPSGTNVKVTINPSVEVQLQLSLCDTVSITYHRGPGGVLVADSVVSTDANATGPCANVGDGGTNPTGQDVVGTITQLTLSSVTISAPSGPMSFAAGLGLTQGYMIGDQVDVTYNPSSGGLVAADVEYQDADVTGTVTAVSAGSITLTDSTTGQTRTFTADPTSGPFDGISVGDQVDLTYHQSAGGIVVDSVSDMTNPG